MSAISLFDYTGNMLKPWAEAGICGYAIDIQHPMIWSAEGKIMKCWADLSRGYGLGLQEVIIRGEVAIIFAFPPCDHLAVSGARWFKGKGLRKLAEAIELFAVAAEICEASGAPYMIENPVSTISTYWRKPDYTFNPCDYTGYCPDDNYTKKTCLWTGNGFVMPEPYRDLSLGEPDDRIHKAPPGPDRANFRSATPMGFAQAVFEANKKQVGNGMKIIQPDEGATN